MLAAASMVSVLLTMASVTDRESSTKRSVTEAAYLADGALEFAKKEIQAAVANWEEPPDEGTVTIGQWEVVYEITPSGGPMVHTDQSGVESIVAQYEVEATAEVDGIVQRSKTLVNAVSTPLFQFAVFYNNDLEMFPGPDMWLTGRIHTNQNIYLGSASTLTFDTNYVRAVGGIYRWRKDGSGAGGDVVIRKWVANPFSSLEPSEFIRMNSRSQMAGYGITSVSGYDSAFEGYDANGDFDFDDEDDWLPFAPGALEFWGPPEDYPSQGFTVLTGAHGIGEAATPAVESVRMFEESDGGSWQWDSSTYAYVEVGPGYGTHEKGFYHDHADLSIIVAEDGLSWEAFDADGTDVSVYLAAAVSLGDVLDTRQSEGTSDTLRVVRVDIEELNGSGFFPANGLLYASHYGLGQGIDAKGVELFNGAELSHSLTVVSESPLYVKGDYNTVDKKSAAVVGDAVNLLSNAWDGSKSAQGTLPWASATTYNCAIVTGNTETVPGQYNGGFENLPRFHENWKNVVCEINGSFVNLFESQFATGDWLLGGNRYKAPLRDWGYDPLFNSVASLPPWTPVAVTAEVVVSW